MKDFLDIENSKGMRQQADSAFAIDFLLTVKTGIRYYAVTLTETANPQLRSVLTKQMMKAIDLHDELTNLMMDHGWLKPHDLSKQMDMDLKAAEMAIDIGKLDLFPKDTSRLGTFATPEH